MHAFFLKNKGGREGVLGRLGCEAKLSGQFFVRASDAESA